MKKMIAIVAAIVLICSLSIVAFALTLWNPKFAELFNANDEQQESLIADGTTVPLNNSVSDNGLTMEAVQLIGDKNGVYILLNITAPEDTLLSDTNLFEKSGISIEGLSDFNSFSGFLYNGEQNATNQRYYEIWIYNNGQDDLNGKTITLSYQNLQADAGKLDMYTILEGIWTLSWTLEYKDHTQTFELNESINIGGYEVMVESLELSPLSMSIKLSGDGVKELAAALDIAADIPASVTLCMILEDGTLFTTYGGPGSEGWTDISHETYIMRKCFDNILDVKQVTGISLNYASAAGSDSVEISLAHHLP